MKTPIILTALALCFFGIAGCTDQSTTVTPTPTPMATATPATTPMTTTMPTAATTPASATGPLSASATLEPTQGNNVRGTVTFNEVADGVRVQVEITGLTPGKHGFHVHEKGDCSAPDAMSAGEHFNPTSEPHAAPDETARHIGDMGNVEADESGTARLSYVDHSLSLLEGDRSIIGRAVIVHANPDDLTSQPSGNAGARLACGIINRTGGSAGAGQ